MNDVISSKKHCMLYLVFVFGFVMLAWLVNVIFGQSNEVAFILSSLFSFYPLLSSLLTRMILKDRSSWMLRPNFRNNFKVYLVAAYIPGILIVIGAIVYFLIFPSHLDLSAKKLIETYGRFGVPSDLPHTVASTVRIGLIGLLVSPFAFPIIIVALGEEIGWRGYLLPKMVKLMDLPKAVLFNGILWGVCHAPKVYFGLNYGMEYFGAPYTGMLMMVLAIVSLNVWISYVTIKTKSIVPACILHGAVNLISEFPALVAIDGINPLLGPNPTGIIGMSALMIGSIVIFNRMRMNTKRVSSTRIGIQE